MCKPASSPSTIRNIAPLVPDALEAASLALTALQRRCLPRENVSQIVSFLAGSREWHIDDASNCGSLRLVQSIHAAEKFTAATICTPLAMDRASRVGNLLLVRWLHENRREGCSPMAFYDAAKHNHLEVLQWLFAYKAKGMEIKGLENGVLYHAVEGGHVSLVQWLCTARPAIVPLYNVLDHASRCGHLPVVQVLHRLGRANPSLSTCSTNAMDAAADQGHLSIVQWLHTHRGEGCTTNAMDYAASRGHLPILQWLHRHRTEGCTRKALLHAVVRNRVDVVEWLLAAQVLAMDVTLLLEAMEVAAYYDHKTLWSMLRQAHKSETSSLPLPSDLFVSTQTRMAT